MRQDLIGFSILATFILCSNTSSTAQKSSGKSKIDSTQTILRKEKIRYPLPKGQTEKNILPLPYYNFNSSLNASFTFTDSLNQVTSKTDYIYFFDKASDFFAIKETYQWKNKTRSSFFLEELKDSAAFRANLNDSIKIMTFKHLHNIHSVGLKLNSGTNQVTGYQKTGQTQLINGILCEAIVLENQDFKNTLWVTTVNDPWFEKVRNDLQHSVYNELTAYTSGVVMISECFYKQTKHTQRFEVTAINKSTSRRIVTEGAKLVGGL